MIEWPLSYKDIFEYLGVAPPRGILICGPPGTGKTQLAMAICGEMSQIPFFKISGPEFVSGISGKSEEKLRNLFKEVAEQAPAIIYIDELDSIAGKRESAGKDMEVRIVAQLMSCMDDLSQNHEPVIVIGATSRPEKIDSSLRREGRFEREISLGVPTEENRLEILKVITKKLRLRPNFNFEDILRLTPGYVGADLSTLCKEASILAVERII
jgi:ribosome biogenesis ATPase